VKETRPKGQRLPNEVDPERAQLHYTPYVKDESDVGMASSWNLLESVDAALLGEPEHFEAHDIKGPEMDGDLIDAVLKPFLDQLPMVSDERDIDEPDADAEVVFKTPIVGGSASLFSQRKLRSHLMNKIHAVDFKLDGSGVVNILDTDVTRDPKKLELRKEPTSFTEDGPVIIRRYDLTDEEHHRQLEKEIFEDTKTAEEKLRAGDPAASIEIRGGFWLRRDCADHWGHCWSVHQAEGPQPWICLTGSLTSRHARATTSPSSRRWEPLRLRSRSSSSLDYDFSVDDLARGLYPKVPIYPHLTEVEVPEEFRIIYHYTSWSSLQAIICTRIFPGASSCKGHVYMTRHAPWEIDGKDPGVRTLCLAIDTDCALHYGIRLVETLAGALICEDWIPNHCLIYAFDCEKSQYLWANHGYNGVKKYLRQKASKNALTWKENEARKGTPDYEVLERHEASDLQALKDLFTDQYPQWKDVVTLRRPLIFKEANTPYEVVDELLPKQKQRPLNFKNILCVARKPTVSAAGFDVAPDNARERRSDRFDQEAFDPAAEGKLTRWRFVSILAMPELTCPRCRKIFPEGMLICLACGLSLATMSDMRRASQIFRLEELAEKLGFELTLDMLGDDDVAGTTQGSKQIRSAAAVLKNHARSYMKQARKAGMSLLQRLGTDAHYGFNCAVQDLTPKCMHWIAVLGNVVLPNIKRTKEEIRTGKVRQYKARMCIVAQELGQMQTLVVDDHVLFWFKNRFYRANHFAAAYAVLPIQDRFEVLSDANTTFQSLALTKQDVYADILSYVNNILRPLTEAVDTEGGSRPLPATRQTNPDYTRSTRPGYGSHQGPTHGYTQQEWNDFYNQWTDQEWEDWRRRNQGHQYRDRRYGQGYR